MIFRIISYKVDAYNIKLQSLCLSIQSLKQKKSKTFRPLKYKGLEVIWGLAIILLCILILLIMADILLVALLESLFAKKLLEFTNNICIFVHS